MNFFGGRLSHLFSAKRCRLGYPEGMKSPENALSGVDLGVRAFTIRSSLSIRRRYRDTPKSPLAPNADPSRRG